MILCVDPDDDRRTAVRDALADAGFQTTGAADLEGAERALEEIPAPTAVVTAYDLPDGTGLDLARVVREGAPDTPIVLFTATPLQDVDTTAAPDVVVDYQDATAPDALDELVARIEASVDGRTQTSYPVRADEPERLTALARFDVANDDLQAALQRLTDLATARFGVDAAAIGVVADHEKRYLSCSGARFDDAPRERAICTYAILDDDVTIVEDVTADPRFADDAALAATGIRFYASAPIVTPEGYPVGTFCLYDGDPRTLDDTERAHLHLFAAEAMDQFQFRATDGATADIARATPEEGT